MYQSISEVTKFATKQSEKWSIPVARWTVWQENAEDKIPPDVYFIDASSRRKLSMFTKRALKMAHDCAFDIPHARFVFASQHGDVTRTTEILFDLAKREELSPTTFSLSVLNACAGMYSIAKQDCSPSIAISAGKSSFGYGLLEAAIQYAINPGTPVIYVYVDEPPPYVCAAKDSDLLPSHAVSILLADYAPIEISCQISSINNAQYKLEQSDSFVNCLLKKKNDYWEGEGNRWNWTYCAR